MTASRPHLPLVAGLLALWLGLPAVALGQGVEEVEILERRAFSQIRVSPSFAPVRATHALDLTVVRLAGTGWELDPIATATVETARILAQCGVALQNVELVEVAAPVRFWDFDTPDSRLLAGFLDLPRPTVYFVANTRQQPAFEAEAIGRGNSRSRPELADSVWITYGARDLEIVLAHELAHVLMNSGEHASVAGNLMQEQSVQGATRLDPRQCARLKEEGERHGLLRLLP
jgi:hypothetical protein